MNQKCIALLIVMMVRQSEVRGVFDHHQFKGLLSIFNDAYCMLSPVEGAYLCETYQLEDFYNTQDQDQKKLPEYALIHEFFNILESVFMKFN